MLIAQGAAGTFVLKKRPLSTGDNKPLVNKSTFYCFCPAHHTLLAKASFFKKT